MSGALASIGAATQGGLASSILGLLRTASWRGVPFEMLDSTDGSGQRWQRFLFPGLDYSRHENLGATDGQIQIGALLIGDDYVRQKKRFEKACRATGPGTLRHPWLGPLKVVLARIPEFKFDHQQQRVVTFSLVFEIWEERPAEKPTTLGGLLDAIDDLRAQATEFLADALAPLGDALGVLALAQTVLARVGAVYDGLLGATSGTGDTGDLAAVAAGPLDALTGGVALAQPGLAVQAAGLLEDVPAALADAAGSGADPAIGPGPAAIRGAQADPAAAATLLLAVGAVLAPRAGATRVETALLQAARIQAVAEATRAAAAIPFESRDQAIAWRDRIAAGQTALLAQLAVAAAAQPLVAGGAWQAARAAAVAWGRDMQPIIGRLPPVRRVVLTQRTSAWAIANAYAGDDPAKIRAAMLDFVTRNRIRHPAGVPPGTYEVLVR